MKRWLQHAIPFCLALLMLVPAYAVDNGQQTTGKRTYQQMFSDVPETHWAFTSIAELSERKAINGYPDEKFYPKNTVTRAEFAKILVVASGLNAQAVPASSFSDVPTTEWSSPFIETAKPYLTGFTSGKRLLFKPNTAALREDVAVAIVRLKGYDTRLADLSILSTMFKDADSISNVARPYVALAVENGLINGLPDGTFRGQATITREEAAAILWRAFQYGNDNKVIPGETPAPVLPTPTAPKGKTYNVETLATFAGTSFFDAMQIVTTGSNDIYVLAQNRIYLVKDGKSTVVMDGDSLTYKISDKELITQVFHKAKTDAGFLPYIEGGESVTFSEGRIVGLAYDKIKDRVLALYAFPATPTYYDTTSDYDYVSMRAVYDVTKWEQPTSRHISNASSASILDFRNGPPNWRSEMQPLVLGNNLYAEAGVFDLTPGIDNAYSFKNVDGFSGNHYHFANIKGQLTGFENAKWHIYDMAAEYKDTSYTYVPDVSFSGGVAFDETNAYIMGDDHQIYQISFTPGKSGMKSPLLLSTEKIDVRDGKTIGRVTALALDADGSFIFFDCDNGLLRKLSVIK